MDQVVCRQCGAELVPQTNFCRQCGVAITPGAEPRSDERTTTLFGEDQLVATQRLDPRPTAPERPGWAYAASPPKPRSKGYYIVTAAAVVLVVAISGYTFTKMREWTRKYEPPFASVDDLLYPGSKKTMDVVAEGRGRAISLETSDSFERVSQWYQAQLKPQKVVQLTEKSVVMKSNSATVTIIGDDDSTKVLLKIVPQ